jgi:hypothetical protein
MNYKIVKNEERKSITAIISPIVIGYTDYLFKKYEGERYFASGIFKDADYKNDILPFAKEIVTSLNEISKDIMPEGVVFVGKDVLSLDEDEFRIISKNLNKDGDWDKQFKINLSSKSKNGERRFLFLDLKGENPIEEKDAWKHIYAVEIEISVGYNEDKLEKYLYSVFHRGISIGTRGYRSQKNDDAWEGFDFGPEKQQQSEPSTKQENKPPKPSEDDLPF